MTAWVRSRRSSLSSTRATWVLTVVSATNSRRPAAPAFFLLGLPGQTHFGLQQRGMTVSFLSLMLTTALVARRVSREPAVAVAGPAPDATIGAVDSAAY
jgi:hypothetical protein